MAVDQPWQHGAVVLNDLDINRQIDLPVYTPAKRFPCTTTAAPARQELNAVEGVRVTNGVPA